MDRKLVRYTLFIVAVVTITIWVDHFQGQWINNRVTNLVTQAISFFEEQSNEFDFKTVDVGIKLPAIETHPEESKETLSRNGYVEVHNSSCTNAVLTAEQVAARKRKQEENLIFSWVDDNGVSHFSDKLFGDEDNIKVLDHYGIELAPFELEITTNRQLPTHFEKEITFGVKKVYQIVGGYIGEKHLKPVKLNLTFAHSKREYQLIQSTTAPSATASQGFYSPSHNLAAIWYKNQRQAKATALHEAVHVVNSGLFGNTPRWLNEGLAEYFEDLQVKGFNAEIKPDDWYLNRSVRNISLNTLISDDNANWNGKIRPTMYSASHSLVYYLMSTIKGKRLATRLFKSLAKSRCQTLDINALLSTYSGGLSALEHDWKQWLKKGKYQTQTLSTIVNI
ncbi:hypothetical protein SOPP22_14855 [Shewanella sp. OPT22]|nr:hypothetical protein SOPP22_14855 [Shewanella sp. OPT22]